MRREKGVLQETHDKGSQARAWKTQFPHAWGHTEGGEKNAKESDCPCLAVYLSSAALLPRGCCPNPRDKCVVLIGLFEAMTGPA